MLLKLILPISFKVKNVKLRMRHTRCSHWAVLVRAVPGHPGTCRSEHSRPQSRLPRRRAKAQPDPKREFLGFCRFRPISKSVPNALLARVTALCPSRRLECDLSQKVRLDPRGGTACPAPACVPTACGFARDLPGEQQRRPRHLRIPAPNADTGQARSRRHQEGRK